MWVFLHQIDMIFNFSVPLMAHAINVHVPPPPPRKIDSPGCTITGCGAYDMDV